MTYYVDEIDGVFFTDRTAATEQEFRDRIAAFESAPTPPEVREVAVVEEVARRAAEVAEQQYREAWAAWEATLPIVAGAPASTESRIAWARVNQALSDQEALVAALAEVTTTPQANA